MTFGSGEREGMLDLLKKKSVIAFLLAEGLLVYLWIRTANPLFIAALLAAPLAPLFAYRIIELDANLLIPLIVALAIVTPPFRLGSLLPWMRIEEVLIFCAGGALALAFLSRPELLGEVPHGARVTLFLAFIFAAAIAASTFHALAFMDYRFNYKDIFEFVKILKLAIVVLLGSIFFQFSDKSLDRVMKVFLYGGILVAAIAAYQVVSQFMAGRVAARPVSLIGNPNYLGIFMSLVGSFAIALYLYRESTTRNALIAAVCISAAVLSLSRTGFVTAIAVVVYHLITGRKSLLFQRKPARHLQFIFITLGLGVGAFLFLVVGTQIGARLIESFTPMEALSFKLRLFVWMYNLQLFVKSPIFGWGPSSLTLSTITDNEYLYMARNYGTVGLLAFLALMVSFYWRAGRISRRPDVDSPSLAFAKGMQGGMVCLLLAGITANNYSNHQLMSILWGLFAVLLAMERTLERRSPRAFVPV